ncbi:MAG: hypothetical protein A2V83_07010 [Nitrospirae bacterium RBG_16_64_22]|nr:MAG: hypothetical protein A2V83_07010 [Nitrospirae bacterium RBG_16_64_22]
MSGRSPQNLAHGNDRCYGHARSGSDRRIGTLLWLAVSAGPLLLAPPAFAKNLEKTPTPISIEAKPAFVIAGGTVTVKGSSVPLGKSTEVTVTIQPPAGPPATEKVLLKGEGNFETKYVPKGPLGKYSVTARAPDGKAAANAEFTVGAAAALSKQTVEKVDRTLDRARKVVLALDQQIRQAPPSPAQEEVKQKLGPLKERLAHGKAHAGKLKEGLKPLDDFVRDHPAAQPGVAPLYTALGEIGTAADEADKRLADVESGLARTGTRCDQLDTMVEAMSAISTVFNMIGSAAQIAANIATDKVVPDAVFSLLPPAERTTESKFMFSQGLKFTVAALSGPAGLYAYASGLASDLIQLKLQQTFAAYCEKFQGPLSATLNVETYEKGKLFWKYSIALAGKLVLRYDKGAAGSAIPVTGEFEGNATKFTLGEDLIVLSPQLRRNLLLRLTVIPQAAPYLEQAGRFIRKATPASFLVPVKGRIEGKKLTVEVHPAAADLDVSGRVLYVMLEPSLPIPHVLRQDIPYQNAHFVLTRSTHKKPMEFAIEVDKGKKISLIRRVYTRDEKRTDLKVGIKVDVKACNPDCP